MARDNKATLFAVIIIIIAIMESLAPGSGNPRTRAIIVPGGPRTVITAKKRPAEKSREGFLRATTNCAVRLTPSAIDGHF